MTRFYQAIDADGHVLEPLDLWDKYIDPPFRERAPRLVIDKDGKERLASRSKILGSRAGSAASAASAPGRARSSSTRPEVRRRQAGRLRPARAHPRHGSRRHRRRLPLSEPRPVRRRGRGPGARRRDVPRLQPLARRLLQALSRPAVRRRHAADAVDRAGHRGDALRPQGARHARRLPAAQSLQRPQDVNDPITSRSGPTAEELDFAIGIHEGGQRGMPTVGVDRFDGPRRAAHHLAHHGDDAGGDERDLGRRRAIAIRSCASASWNRAAAGSRPGSTAWTATSTTRASTIPA